jgi:hypothetical protein
MLQRSLWFLSLIQARLPHLPLALQVLSTGIGQQLEKHTAEDRHGFETGKTHAAYTAV